MYLKKLRKATSKMNNRGGIYAAVLLALMIFIVGMTIMNFISPEITTARNAINCASPSTDGTKLMCLNIDIVLPYFILLVLSISGGIIFDKLLI